MILQSGTHSSILNRNGSHMSTHTAAIPLRCRLFKLHPKVIVQGLLLALPAKPQRLRGFQVAHHRQELVLLALVQFIHSHMPQRWRPPAGLATAEGGVFPA